MSHDNFAQRLVYMANQIGKFFASHAAEEAIIGIENHFRKFWDPRMRSRILAHLDAGGEGLDDYPRQAVANLRGAADAERQAGTVEGNPALSGAKLATGEDRQKPSHEAEPMIPDEVARQG